MIELIHKSYQSLVLVVDDDRATRLMLSHILEKDNYKVAEAENGVQALAMSKLLQPDLVIMDAMMPIMDGFTACARLLEMPGRVPVLMLTSLDDDHSMELSFEAGAADLITKPIHWTVLRKRVRQLLDAGQNKALLNKTEESANFMFSQSLDGIIIVNAAGRIISFNPAAEQIFGYPPAEIIGHEITILMPGAFHNQDNTDNKSNSTRNNKLINNSREVTGKHKDGYTMPIQLTASGYAAEQLLTVRDLTEHKQAEHKLHLAAKIFECIREGIVVTDPDMVIQSINPAFTTITGYSEGEVMGRLLDFLKSEINHDHYKTLTTTLMEHGQWQGTCSLRKKNNELFTARVSISALTNGHNQITEYVAVITDLTEQLKIAEERKQFLIQTARAQKMASLGTMSAGIAHEINQPLNSIKVLADSMLYWHQRDRLRVPDKIAANIKKISQQAGRIDGIIKHMRSFVNLDHVFELQPCSINEAIIGALDLMGRQLATHGIVIKKVLAKKLPAVLGNGNRLEEAVINLLVNSMQSLDMTTRDDKEISCRTYLAHQEVVLEISDNGTGISDDIKELIFEPFFSTKQSGEGMGLGLTIVQSVIKSCHGEIDFWQNESGGTTFMLRLPAMPKVVQGGDKKP